MGDHRRRLVASACAALLAVASLGAVALAAGEDAVDDAYTTDEDTPLVITAPGLLENDLPNDGSLCVTGVVGGNLMGSLSDIGEDGSLTYTPPEDFNGADSFGYSISVVADGACGEEPLDTAAVTVTVTPVNDPPTAAGDTFSALADRTLNVGAPGVLGNDHDIDGDVLSAVKVSDPTHGVVTLAADGGFSYTPNAGYVGPDAFSYRASDGSATSPTRLVKLTVASVPTPVPTLAPTPTAAPTPTPEITAEPSPSESVEPLPTEDPNASSTATPAPSPTASPTTDPAAGPSGLSLPVLVVGLLLLSLVAFGAALAIPRWLQRQGTDGPLADDPDADLDDDR